MKTEENLDQIERQLRELEDDFQPAGSIGPEIELLFDGPANPFNEVFEDEEIVIDRYASLEADLFADRPLVNSSEGRELADLLNALAEHQSTGTTLSITGARTEAPAFRRADLGAIPPTGAPRRHMRGRIRSQSCRPGARVGRRRRRCGPDHHRRGSGVPVRAFGGTLGPPARIPPVVRQIEARLTRSVMGHLVEAFKKLDQKRAGSAPSQPVAPTRSSEPPCGPSRFVGLRRPKHAAKSLAHRRASPLVAAHHVSSHHRRRASTDSSRGTRAAGKPKKSSRPTPIRRARRPPHDLVNRPIAPAPPESQASGDVTTGESAAESLVGEFPAPRVPTRSYYQPGGTAWRRRRTGAQRPHSVLLAAVSSAAARRRLGLAALAAVLSSQGNVLWIDTRNVRPTPAAVGPVAG